MEILQRKDVYNHEAAELVRIGESTDRPGRWYGRGCAQAGFAPGSVVYAYYLEPLAGLCGSHDVTCAGEDAAEAAAELQATDVGPAPNMGDDWVIAAFPHDADQSCGWTSSHVHCLIVMGTPAEIGRAFRDHEEAMSRSW
jgi:hypothetical protein